MNLCIERYSAVGPWGGPAGLPGWLAAGECRPIQPLPPLPNVVGFASSPFINLTWHTMADCLRGGHADPAGPIRLGIVLASVLGDLVTADRASRSVAAGEVPVPMLFYQSVPVSVLGRVSIDFAATGPLLCLSGGPELAEAAFECAETMLSEDVDAVLIGYAEAGQDQWRVEASASVARLWNRPLVPDWDCAISMLVRPGHSGLRMERAGCPAGLPRPFADFATVASQSRCSNWLDGQGGEP
ncbi:MAG TPA: hypothetical protein VJ851_09510 [Jatrophihabitans sp.]|nr:hypothetical protein [Jatrophihabitans sp.]